MKRLFLPILSLLALACSPKVDTSARILDAQKKIDSLKGQVSMSHIRTGEWNEDSARLQMAREGMIMDLEKEIDSLKLLK